jgi:uncharacterized membrane protein YjjP (DUF1212 family)
MSREQELNLTLDFCLRVGELLLSSGAGAADVTATMLSLARQLGAGHADVDVTFTSLSMSHQSHAEDWPLIATRQVRSRVTDYLDLTKVDHLVRAVLRDEVGLKEARSELLRIVSTGHDRPRWAVSAAWGVMCAGVATQLGGDPVVVAIALVAAVVIDRLQLRMARRRLPGFYLQVAGGAVATLIAVGAQTLLDDLDVSQVITANIVVLLAGVGFLGAIQDALTGFYITAVARVMEAMLATAGIIGGVTGGLSLAGAVGLEIPPIDPTGSFSIQQVGLTVAGAAVAAAAYAFASYSPKRVLVPLAGVAAVAMLISQSVNAPGIGRAWSVALAALFVGLVGYGVSARLRVPPLVVVVSAVVPMLPGLSIYRGLSLMAEGSRRDTAEGLLAIITAAAIAIALAAGVILGEYLAQPLEREARRLEQRLSGPRLVGPVRTVGRRRGMQRAAQVSQQVQQVGRQVRQQVAQQGWHQGERLHRRPGRPERPDPAVRREQDPR